MLCAGCLHTTLYLRVLSPLDVVTNDDEALGLGPPDHTDVVSCRHITHPQHLIHVISVA